MPTSNSPVAMDGGKAPLSDQARKNRRTREKASVLKGSKRSTASGQKQNDLTTNKAGRPVSKAKHQAGKQNPWVKATMTARENLIRKGTIKKGIFTPVGGNTPAGKALLAEARRIYGKK